VSNRPIRNFLQRAVTASLHLPMRTSDYRTIKAHLEPADLDRYAALLPAPLGMPEKPLLLVELAEVSCVMPGGIKTNIARNTRFPASATEAQRQANTELFERWLARTSAPSAVRAIVRGIRRGRTRIRVGVDAHVMDVLSRALPRGWQRFMGWVGSLG
jgi:hypothetical protein